MRLISGLISKMGPGVRIEKERDCKFDDWASANGRAPGPTGLTCSEHRKDGWDLLETNLVSMSSLRGVDLYLEQTGPLSALNVMVLSYLRHRHHQDPEADPMLR